MIPRRWYGIYDADKLTDRPVAVTRLGEKLVLWRDGEGGVHAALDRCPHKGALLSEGRIVSGELSCPYHGFRFDGGGQCTAIPVHPQAPIPRAMCLKMRTVRQQHGVIWMWSGPGPADGEIPWFDDHPWPAPLASSASLVYPVHYSRLVESNFDVYHFPFIHRSIDPGVGAVVEDVEVVVTGERIETRGVLKNAKGRATPFSIDFLPPNVQRLRFAGIDGVIISTPIDDEQTWMFARYQQDWLKVPLLGRWLSALSLWIEIHIVQTRQDIPILATLTPRSAEPGGCVWVGADRGAARYVQWRARQMKEADRAETPVPQARPRAAAGDPGRLGR